ncbi:hypothetical protein GMRT_15900 [Giardia muris]|uniref:Uncharacterized protein n=1 Tax=Giardia muris TaxID=5742 RepID=A0A4Z1TBP6_GIAMU|nr:hypothetical protein GMRT_15900 [Giardia muris]|eukprot:TNJ29949.1 hypothetical protein GMRT_15900 [Giardia muris]
MEALFEIPAGFVEARPKIAHIVELLNRKLAGLFSELEDEVFRHDMEMSRIARLVLLRSHCIGERLGTYDLLQDHANVIGFIERQQLRSRFLELACIESRPEHGQTRTMVMPAPESHIRKTADWCRRLISMVRDEERTLRKVEAELRRQQTSSIPLTMRTSLRDIGVARGFELLRYEAFAQEVAAKEAETDARIADREAQLQNTFRSPSSIVDLTFGEQVEEALSRSHDLLAKLSQHVAYFEPHLEHYGDDLKRYSALAQQQQGLLAQLQDADL